MTIDHQYNFLRVKKGRTYFARISISVDFSREKGVRVATDAGAGNPYTPVGWVDAACIGAEKALSAHIAAGGFGVGMTVTSVLGTEVDTTENTIEIAAFCAGWKALGHSENELSFEFDGTWRIIMLS